MAQRIVEIEFFRIPESLYSKGFGFRHSAGLSVGKDNLVKIEKSKFVCNAYDVVFANETLTILPTNISSLRFEEYVDEEEKARNDLAAENARQILNNKIIVQLASDTELMHRTLTSEFTMPFESWGRKFFLTGDPNKRLKCWL